MKEGRFKTIDMMRLYKKYGLNDMLSTWKKEVADYSGNSVWLSGSPCSCMFDGEKNLLKCENHLESIVKEMGVTGFCTYYTEEFRDEGFTKLGELINKHSGVIFYDSDNSILMRNKGN